MYGHYHPSYIYYNKNAYFLRTCLVMAKKIWISLFVSFIVYTGFVYSNCDVKQVNVPDVNINNGWRLWQEKNCQSCHQIYGLGGYMGPDLTNVASEKGTGYMHGFIKNGTGRMPDFHLRDEEVADIITFLAWVDKSGQNMVKEESVHWSGTYINHE